MKVLLTQIIVLLCASLTFAQYQVGVPVQDTIYSGQYTSFEQCAPYADVSIDIHSALNDFVTGLELILVITAIEIDQGELSNTHGLVNVGDEMAFMDSDEFFTFYFSNTGHFDFAIIAKGTPQVANESYPCVIEGLVTQVTCQNGYIIQPEFFSPQCSVLMGVTSTFENSIADQTKIYPNPGNGLFNIQRTHLTKLKSIEVFNPLGQLVLRKDGIINAAQETLDLTTFDSGHYLIKFNTGDLIFTKRLVKR